jgi:hypothetical protein
MCAHQFGRLFKFRMTVNVFPRKMHQCTIETTSCAQIFQYIWGQNPHFQSVPISKKGRREKEPVANEYFTFHLLNFLLNTFGCKATELAFNTKVFEKRLL